MALNSAIEVLLSLLPDFPDLEELELDFVLGLEELELDSTLELDELELVPSLELETVSLLELLFVPSSCTSRVSSEGSALTLTR